MKLLTMAECKTLAVGDRVVFAEQHDIFPICIVPAGTTGTVARNTLGDPDEHYIHIAVDTPSLRDVLAEWDGCVILGEWLEPHGDDTWDTDSPLTREEHA